jgi:hypothetical protein
MQHYVGGVPDDRMIILDLTAEEVPMWDKIAKNNKSFIWCMLHNYGGARYGHDHSELVCLCVYTCDVSYQLCMHSI